MIKDLDDTLKALLETYAPPNSLLADAAISFELPDAAWRAAHPELTLNCYLYDIRQNMAMRTSESLIVRSADDQKMVRIAPPARIDCAYCITAWSTAQGSAIHEEHRLLSDALRLLLKHTTIPQAVLQGSLVGQFPPFPGIVASQEGVKNVAEFWHALDQKLKPSLNFIFTLAILPDDVPTDAQMPPSATKTEIGVGQLE